jgi:hypothetical protein
MLAKGNEGSDANSGSRASTGAQPIALQAQARDASSAHREVERIAAMVRALERRLAKLCSRLSRLEEDLQRFEFDLVQFLRSLSGADAPPRRGRVARDGTDDDDAVADRGVRDLAINAHFDGSAHVRIEGSRPLRLSPALVNLLEVLAAERPSSDHLVGWKPLDEIAAQLAAREGVPLNEHAVSNRIWLLRQALIEAGFKARLVQHHPRKGHRFALRRVGSDVPTHR